MEPKNESGVYAIIHVPTKRRYVGSTINLLKRMRHHFHVLKYCELCRPVQYGGNYKHFLQENRCAQAT